MKLFKPISQAYDTNQKNFNYEYQENKSQFNYSNYEYDNKSNYNTQASNNYLGQPISKCGANGSNQVRSNKATNFHANAQQAYPSPSIYVQQGRNDHVMEKMNMKESHMGKEWASYSPKCPNSAQLDHSSHTMHNEKHMMGEMGYDWAKKPNNFSSPTQKHNFSQSMYNRQEEEAYGYNEDQNEGGYANMTNMLSTPSNLSPIKTNHQSSVLAHNERKMGSMSNSWANSSSNFSSPTQAQQSGMKMHNREHMGGNMNLGWANSPTKFSNSTQAQQSHLSMQRKEHMLENEDHDDLGYLSNNFSNTTTQGHGTNMGMHKEEGILGELDHGWSNSPTKFSSQAHQTNMSLHKGGHMMGGMGHGWSNSPTKFSSQAQAQAQTQAHQTNMSMHKGGHMMGDMDHGWASSPTKYSSPRHSGYATQKEAHMMGQSSQGWANSPTHYSGPNQFTSSRGLDNQHEWGGNSSNQFGASHVNSRSIEASYDHNDQYVDDDVHEIMDEILTKYPAHNVSGGHGSSWASKNSYGSQNIGSSHAKQQAFGGSAHYGSVSSMNGGYMSNSKKEEYSSSSSAKKFEASSMMNKGGYYI